jgi:hypothetical protein
MQPGESRWIGLRFPAAAGKAGEILAVEFTEMYEGVAINGFAIGARLGSLGDCMREKLERHRSELTRLAATGVDGATESAAQAAKLARGKRIATAAYVEFAGAQAAALKRGVGSLGGAADAFSLGAALAAFTRAVKSKDAGAVAVCHDCLLNRIDSALTMRQLAEGDPAGILHNVRWQRDLFRTLAKPAGTECAPRLLEECEAFIEEYGIRKRTSRDYPELVRAQLECLTRVARELQDQELATRAKDVEGQLGGDLAKLQKAHQGYLQRLDEVGRGRR